MSDFLDEHPHSFSTAPSGYCGRMRDICCEAGTARFWHCMEDLDAFVTGK
jgi:hypothetical protein